MSHEMKDRLRNNLNNKKLLECAFSGKSMLLVLPRRLKTRK